MTAIANHSTRHAELMGRNVLVQRLGRTVAGRIVDTVDGVLPNGETGATFVAISPRAAQDVAISGEWINVSEVTFENAPVAAPVVTTPVKTITYDRLTGDYKMELDGEFVGYEATYHAAEVELDRLACERLDRAGAEPELALSATALDGVCVCGAVFNEYGQCETCISDMPRIDPEIHPGDYLECFPTDPDDTPADDHNLVTPDPAECPSTTEPQPVEDCPACATPDDDGPADDDEDSDDWPDGIDGVLAPSWPTASSNTPCFILPTGTTARSIILCIGGVSRVVSAQGVAEALTLASVHARPVPRQTHTGFESLRDLTYTACPCGCGNKEICEAQQACVAAHDQAIPF